MEDEWCVVSSSEDEAPLDVDEVVADAYLEAPLAPARGSALMATIAAAALAACVFMVARRAMDGARNGPLD